MLYFLFVYNKQNYCTPALKGVYITILHSLKTDSLKKDFASLLFINLFHRHSPFTKKCLCISMHSVQQYFC